MLTLRMHTALLSAATKAFFERGPLYNGFYVLEDDPMIAKIWRHFLYWGEISTQQENGNEEWAWLADAYLLGVSVQDEKFCNAVIDALIDKQFETTDYPTTLAEAVWANTQNGDCLRRLIADMHIWAGHGAGLIDTGDGEDGPIDLRRTVRCQTRQLAMQIKDPKEPYPWEDACRYHKHTVTEECVAQI